MNCVRPAGQLHVVEVDGGILKHSRVCLIIEFRVGREESAFSSLVVGNIETDAWPVVGVLNSEMVCGEDGELVAFHHLESVLPVGAHVQ